MKVIPNKPSGRFRIAPMLIGGLVLIAVLALGLVMILTRQQPAHPTPQEPSANSETKGETATTTTTPSSPTGTNAGSSNTTTGNPKTDTTPTVTDLKTPSGDFVSAHHITADTPINSVCNTSPGATCQISFNNGSITKTLPERTTDRGGSAYWDHVTGKDIGLKTGSWKVQAIARFNDQTKTADDALLLEITE